ncbi:hypothetical protein CFSAN000599_22000 [Salmonella enterica subsp. enterica serovar Newport str. CFSAN000599]|nr:hypothetical protein [Salmonella enterica subsp. enterica serovar Newport str. CFSAN000599]
MTEQDFYDEVVVIEGKEYPMRAVSRLYGDIAETLLDITKELTLRGEPKAVIKERCETAASCAANAYLILIPRTIRSRPNPGHSDAPPPPHP